MTEFFFIPFEESMEVIPLGFHASEGEAWEELFFLGHSMETGYLVVL